MRLTRLFTDQPLLVNTTITLEPNKSHYITHVLRLKKGQDIILFNGLNEYDHLSQIINMGKTVEISIQKAEPTHKESTLNTTIYQALSKNEHLDFMIQKSTELGVNRIIIFNSERTQIPLKTNKLEKKQQHWKRIAQSACEQSGRSIAPCIEFYPKFSDVLTLKSNKNRIMLDFNGVPITDIVRHNDSTSIDILIGAEGGLSNSEIQMAEQAQFNKVRLGTRILRTETAAITALSLIQMIAGDLN